MRYSISLSLSLSFIRSRERSLIPKGHSTKTTKITLKGIETTFPRRGTDRSLAFFSRLRHTALSFSLSKSQRFDMRDSSATFWIESNRIESNALASVVRAPKTVKTTTPFLHFKANKNPLSNNVFLPVTDACCVSQREKERKMSSDRALIMNWMKPTAADSTLVVRRSRVRRGCRTARTHRLVSPFTHDDDGFVLFVLLKGWWWCSFERKKSEAFGVHFSPNETRRRRRRKSTKERALECAVVEVVLLVVVVVFFFECEA